MNNKILNELVKWHRLNRAHDLVAAFELGDMVLSAVVNSGMTEYNVVKSIRKHLGNLAYGVRTYSKAAQIARTFTANQRRVLIDKCVPIDTAVVLAGKAYAGKRRTNYIQNIKTGKLSNWKEIRGPNEKPRSEGKYLQRVENGSDDIVITVRRNGEFQRELMFDGLRALVSQVPQDILTEMLNLAVTDCQKRGLKLSEYLVLASVA